MKITRAITCHLNYWFPRVKDRLKTKAALASFYATRTDYHAMTAVEDKDNHPQARFLFDQLHPDDVCAEFGCGGGVVITAVAKRVRSVIGLDIGNIALQKAKARSNSLYQLVLAQADVTHAPVRSESANVVYSFEVLEHVWNPEAVLIEMLRVLRPGGLLVVSVPAGFPLDFHRKKRALVAAFDYLAAAMVWVQSHWWPHCFKNIEPDLDCHPAYGDCDIISKIHPRLLEEFIRHNGCTVERLETYFLRRMNAPTSQERAYFERLERHPLFHLSGDWILLVARKNT